MSTNVVYEIARKEALSYYAHKGIILQNALLAIVFCLLPVQQLGGLLAASGYRISALGSMLEAYLLFATLYPIVIASGISIFAFPAERDQKTIEHLLSLPPTDGEIFLGKALAAIATALAWAVVIFSAILGYTLCANAGRLVWDAPLLTPSLCLLLFGIVPAVIVLSTLMTVALSTRMASARGAYLVNIVVMGIIIGITSVKSEIRIDPVAFDIALLVSLAVLVAATYALSVKGFDREKLMAKT